MAVVRQAYQLIAVKVRLFDPLNPVAILEPDPKFQPGVVFFQAVLQVPFTLPCAASVEPFRPTSPGIKCVYRFSVKHVQWLLSLPHAPSMSVACWKKAGVSLQTKPPSSLYLVRSRGPEEVCRQRQRAFQMELNRQRTRLALDALVLKHHCDELADLMVLHILLAPHLHMTLNSQHSYLT